MFFINEQKIFKDFKILVEPKNVEKQKFTFETFNIITDGTNQVFLIFTTKLLSITI